MSLPPFFERDPKGLFFVALTHKAKYTKIKRELENEGSKN